MITIINTTNIPFKAVLGDATNKKDNRRVTITHGRMRIDAFIETASVASFVEHVNGLKRSPEAPGTTKYIADTRLYFSNKEYQPIIVQSKSNNANFLLLAHALGEKERIVRTEFDSVFAVTRGFVKGKYIATSISFRTDRESFFRLTTTDGETVRITTYTGHLDGTISEVLELVPVAEYKGFNLNDRGTIRPYRPHKATHLVFSVTDQVEHAIKGNHTIETFTGTKELADKIASYKEIGFQAVSFYADIEKAGDVAGKDLAALKLLQENFRLVYLVTRNGFAQNVSIKPVLKRNNKPKSLSKNPVPNNISERKPNVKTNGKPFTKNTQKQVAPKKPQQKQRTNRAGIPVQQ